MLLKKHTKILMKCNQKRLEQQCENENEQSERRKFLNRRIEQRKNLYIYPEQVNA